MASKYYHVQGAPAFGSQVPLRKEFNEFAKDADVLNLYLLALERIQNADQSKLTSHFQIGGIHGKPYIPWDNVQGLEKPKFGGYCTHASVVFPTWHRPYVALYEQAIWNEASLIADSYENRAMKERYQEAVRRLRQPYWDWAADSTLHSLLNTDKTVIVITAPKGKSEEIPNPLICYRFHPIDPSFAHSFSDWPQTIRYPTSSGPSAQSQPNKVQEAMNSRHEQLRTSTYDLLAYVHDWLTMSNTTTSTASGISLEGIHNLVHLLIGGNGHMSDNGMAGFDPIFFLHHANVDRLLALWQALNPTAWIVPGNSDEGSITIAPNTKVDGNTDLTPFHVNDETFWTSMVSRDTASFGYTYPEIGDLGATPEELKTRVTRAVMKLYGPRFLNSDEFTSADSFKESAQLALSATDKSSASPGHEEPAQDDIAVAEPQHLNRYIDWFATVTVNPHHFASSGYIHLFLSDTVPHYYRSSYARIVCLIKAL